ncbi:MAG: hypothetical protein H6818_04550 [Phycisphaerales bacterium]|nr:hypothetical protein [Phycisphaerales bacterium]
MAEQRRNEFMVGVFTIIVVALFVTILIWIGKAAPGGQQRITIRFKPTPIMPPIKENAQVIVGGQPVGKVVSAALISEGGSASDRAFFVEVVADIREDLVLHADCAAVPEAPALGGDALIKLDLGTMPAVFAGGVIEGSDPAGFAGVMASVQSELDANNPKGLLSAIKLQLDPDAENSLLGKLNTSLDDVNSMTSALALEMSPSDGRTLMGKIQRVAENINAVTGSLRQQFDDGEPDVLLTKLHFAIDSINGSLETVARVLATSEAPITRTLANVEDTSVHIAEQTDPDRPDSLMAEFRAASIKINESLKDMNTVTKTTRDVLVLNRENINRMLVNFKESSDHIKTGVKYVLRNPWQLLNPPNPNEIKEQAILDAARSFAEAATSLDDATAQLKALAELHNGTIPFDDPDLQQLRAELKTTQEKYQQAEAKLWAEFGKTQK